MPWGLVGGAVINYLGSDNAADKAADATKNASKSATALQQQQFERGLKEVAPFKESGLTALPGLQAAANETFTPFSYRDQNQYLSNYFNSPEYNILNKQANDQILRTASATGGIRNGNTNASLMNVAPTLGIDALNRVNQQDTNVYSINQGALQDRYNRLYGLANLGANVATGNQSAGANFASNAGANALAAGQAQSAASIQQGKALSGLASDLGSLYTANKLGYFDQQNSGKI